MPSHIRVSRGIIINVAAKDKHGVEVESKDIKLKMTMKLSRVLQHLGEVAYAGIGRIQCFLS